MLPHQLLCLLLGDHRRQGRRAEVIFAAEKDLPGAVVLLTPDDALGPVARVAGVVVVFIQLAHPEVAAGL